MTVRGRKGHLSGGLVVLLTAGLLISACGQEEKSSGVSPPPARMMVLGPGGGGSTFIPTFHPEDPERILLRCDMGGAYLTTDGGASWKMFSFPGGTRSLAFDPNQLDTVYVGAAGLHVSRNAGLSWQQIFPDPESVRSISYRGDHASPAYKTEGIFPGGPGNSVSAILVDSEDSNHLLAGVNGQSADGRLSGLFGSRDGGESWTRIASFQSPVIAIFELEGQEPGILVLTRRERLLLDKAADATREGVLPFESGSPSLEAVDGGRDGGSGGFILWAVGRTEGGLSEEGGSLFQSSDLGLSWQPAAVTLDGRDGMDAMASFSDVSACRSDARVVYTTCNRWLAENPNGERGHWYGVLKSGDGGASWGWSYRAGGGASDYTVRDGWKADNVRDSWVREAFAGEYIRMLDISVDPRNPEAAVFTDWYRAMKTGDGGATWSALYSETLDNGFVRSRGLDVTTSYGVHFDPFNQDHMAVSYTDIGYFHSFDRGRTWKRSVEGVPPAWDNTCYWLQFDPSREGRVWSAWSSWHDIPRLKMIRRPDWKEQAVGGVCRSDDGGRSWVVTSRGLPENAPVTSLVLDTASPEQERVLYAAVYGQGVFKSLDGGESWQLRNLGLGSNLNAWELSLAADGALYLVVSHNTLFEDGRVLPDLAPGELYRSRDGAASWEPVSLPPGVRYPNSLAIDPGSPGRLFLACWAGITRSDYGGGSGNDADADAAGGVWLSEDGGSTWFSVYDPAAYVYGVSLDPRIPGRVYLNTFQGGAFFSDNLGRSWDRIAGYGFNWGHRVIPDPLDPALVYLTTFGGSVFHGPVE